MPRRPDDEEEAGRPRRRSRFQDDDDDDDRPGRRSSGGSSGIMWVIAFGIAGLVIVFGGIGTIAFILLRAGGGEVAGEEPQAAAQAIQPAPGPGLNVGAPRPAPRPRPNPVIQPPAFPPLPAVRQAPPIPGVVPLPSTNPRITQIVFGGDPEGYAAIVAYKDEGVGSRVDIVKTSTGEVKGQVLTDSPNDNGFALSPDGNWLAVLGSAPSQGHPVRLYTSTGQEVKSITPYPRGGARGLLVPETVWIAFVAKDRLLTINEGGGFDVWSVPDLQRLAGQPSRPAPFLPRVQANLFTRCPANFAITPDGKKLALFNGTGFSFHDLARVAETARTPAFMKANGSANFHGAAFSPDGKRLACYFTTYSPQSSTGLAIWDTDTGKQVGGGPTKGVPTPAGMGWWGSSHLLFWRGGVADAEIFSVDTRQVVGRVATTIPGKLGTVPPNGQLWGTTGGALFGKENGAAFLIRADIPLRLPPKADLEVTVTGLKVK